MVNSARKSCLKGNAGMISQTPATCQGKYLRFDIRKIIRTITIIINYIRVLRSVPPAFRPAVWIPFVKIPFFISVYLLHSRLPSEQPPKRY